MESDDPTPRFRPKTMLNLSTLCRFSVLLSLTVPLASSLASSLAGQVLPGVPVGGLEASRGGDSESGAKAASEAAARLGRALERIRHDKAETAFSELRAVSSPRPSDHYLLGWMYRYGQGVEPDRGAAIREFMAAGEGLVPQAYLHLAELAQAAGDHRGFEGALGQAALMGEVDATWQLACLLREGRGGVTKRPERAFQWATLAAEGGHKAAKSRLRHFVREAKQAGATLGFEAEVEALRSAVRARMNEGLVSLQLGLRSHVDQSADRGANEYQGKNYEKALGILRPLADGGHPVALFYVARILETGRGVAKDPARAVALYLRATRLGISTAADNLGLMVLRGQGTVKNPAAAAKLFQIAAANGDVDGMLNYGYCLGTGTGLERNLVSGAAWYQLAAARGSEAATKNHSAVLEEMTAEQIEQAKEVSERLGDLVDSRGFDPAKLPEIPQLESLR